MLSIIRWSVSASGIICILLFLAASVFSSAPDARLRIIVETDAGGDPDDEQSLVRFLVCANEFDIEGIIANRPVARDRENKNPVRDGLGIVRAMVKAYGECQPNLIKHDARFPSAERLLSRTVGGYDDTEDGVNLIIRAVDADDPRPVWFCNWGTDKGSAVSCLKRALDRVLRERGAAGYAKFKQRIHLSSADKFGAHTGSIEPPFPIWVFASQPEMDGKRWYHRFSVITATAGGFDIERDVRHNHGPLGAMYPVNTNLRQKEGDTMYFLYLLPTGMNDPMHPAWGSWGGRYGPHDEFPGKPYYWANLKDTWQGTTSRDNTLARWAAALQNDFAARMNWCVADDFKKANHPPKPVLNGDATRAILTLRATPGEHVELSSKGSTDPDGDALDVRWFIYPEAGVHSEGASLSSETGESIRVTLPADQPTATVHVILALTDHGTPALTRYRRAVIAVGQ
ncbi:MAG: nucleoside hydrolase-like domain-containing protein [Chthoniobacteraceae bacterium]